MSVCACGVWCVCLCVCGGVCAWRVCVRGVCVCVCGVVGVSLYLSACLPCRSVCFCFVCASLSLLILEETTRPKTTLFFPLPNKLVKAICDDVVTGGEVGVSVMCDCMTRQDKRQDNTRQHKTTQGKTRQDKTRQDKARQDKTTQHNTTQDNID